jgi:zinc metalloprotease ZmpB
MADDPNIIYDQQGHPRQFSFARDTAAMATRAAVRARAPSPQEAAKEFLAQHADILQLPQAALNSVDVRAAMAPVPENESLRFEKEKNLMDSTIVSYSQTMFGLPIYEAGVSVVVHSPDNEVKAATSTLHYGIEAHPPGDTLTGRAMNAAAVGSYDDLVRSAIPDAANMRINRTQLMVYQYSAAKRTHGHEPGDSEPGFHSDPPSLPLPPVPPSIVEGKHYVAVEALFSLPLPNYGMLNWRAFIEPDSRAVLYLRALVDGVTGLVFERDPMTKTGNPANLPTATSAVLDVLRDNTPLVNLTGPIGGLQSLSGTFVKLAEISAPVVAPPTTTNPFNFAYVSRTNDFAAANAYYHCDRFFRVVQDLGFNIASYFGGTSFPVPVDHRGMGNAINAQCPGNTMGNGIGGVQFALADATNVANPIGIAADWRVVLHELGGHGILWNHVNSPNFGFSHSAGDSIAVILNDPETALTGVARYTSFPWVDIGRFHNRPVNGWGWGGVNDVGGYNSEQILATCHFRLYQSIGGDSAYLPRRQFAAASAVYLIVRGVGQLTPATNPPAGLNGPLAWEQQLETADAGVWTRTNPAETHAGGAYHKVIRWAFEKQGLFRAPGAPATVQGQPPAVDVYIDDGRHGEYPFQPNHWSCTDIWNRTTMGAGGGVHQEPIVGQTNFAYVRIKNRGTQPATNVVVKGFHALPGAGLDYPNDWLPMATPQLTAPNLAASDAVGVVVGPFKWVPSQVGHECMFFSVSAKSDASNIDGAITGTIPEWRLVPHDNNIAQRNVHPVSARLAGVNWDKLPFWIRNNGKSEVRTSVEIAIPAWLTKLGWKFHVPQVKAAQVVLRPNQTLKANLAVGAGTDFDATVLARESDHDIVVTVLHDKFPVGGMTFRVSQDAGAVTELSASSRKRTTSAAKASRKPARAGKKRTASSRAPKRNR